MGRRALPFLCLALVIYERLGVERKTLRLLYFFLVQLNIFQLIQPFSFRLH